MYLGMYLRLLVAHETEKNNRYSMVSEQSKGASKYVKMRGQAVEEVQTKTEYTSAVRPFTCTLPCPLAHTNIRKPVPF